MFKSILKFITSTHSYILALPLLCMIFGAASNQLVLNANGDTFPVRINAAKLIAFTHGDTYTLPDGTVMLDDTHCVMTGKTHLNLLADIIDFHGEGIESIGDMLIDFGNWSWAFAPYVWGFAVLGKLCRSAT